MEEVKHKDQTKITKKHPLERANIITSLFFCWLIPYFVKGYKKQLDENDMYGPLKEHESKRLGDKLENAWKYEVAHKKSPSLWRAILKVFGLDLGLYAIIFVFRELVVNLSQPILITKFLKYYEPNQNEMTKNEAYIYGALIALSTLLIVMTTHNYILRVMHLGIKIRVATCSLIYRKALKLNRSALAETTVGQMVNLLSNDVGRFNQATSHVHFIWLTPIELTVVSWLIYTYVGLTGLIGTLFLFLSTPLQMYMGKKTSQYRLRTALLTDERVRLMSEIINGIQIIKMYTWEKPFAKLVEISRRKEMQQIRATSVIRALVATFHLTLNRVAVYLCILTYVLTGNTISATFAYTISSFYGSLRDTMTKSYPRAVTQLAETNISVKRVQKFLLYDEVENKSDNTKEALKLENFANGIKPPDAKPSSQVYLKNVSAGWVNSSDYTLENVTFEAHSDQLVAVVGPVGAGKTTLLHVILKELSPAEGSVNVNGSLAYASQEPWIFGGSVMQNILFGNELIPEKYKEVARVCALERDFSLLPYGDRTLISDRGVTLSGGQRARISLARAIYKDADIYLLDDPLSAVDNHVGKQLFDECICGYLKNKCVILITHQLQYLTQVKVIYLLQNGKVEASGTYSDLQESKSDFTKLLLNQTDQEEVSDEPVKNLKKSKHKVLDKDIPTREREQRGVGIISRHVYRNYIKAGGNCFKLLFLAVLLVISQASGSATDYFITLWVNLEQWRLTNNEVHANDTIDIDSGGNSGMRDSIHYLLNHVMTEDISVFIYSFLIIATIVITIIRSIYFYMCCMTASTHLHNLMFDKIVYATMRFFSINPSGRILNRFSNDIGIIDESLPVTILDTVQLVLTVVASSLIVGILNPWIFAPTLIILAICYYLRLVFLATSRDIKRVEAVTRSPIYTHLSASLQGLITIRAFGAQEVLKREFDNYQNQNTAPSFMFLAANRTFGFWLDFHCAVYIGLVIISILFIQSETFGGNVGLALTQSIALTGMFQFGMRQWSELENNMTSVERVQEYTDVVPEKDKPLITPPKFWPENGGIKFKRVYLRYSPDDPYVLKNLNFEIKAKEKIGIVGRTGAGKSSLIAAMFRLTDLEGAILIDDINTTEVALQVLRSKISIIPQEPVLFSGSLRRNLDPFDEYSDDVIWSALEEVEMKNSILDLPAGLETRVSEGGSNFSVGQRQLLCLARTIIHNNKILILDEATANVDAYTDGLIQTTIRRKFAECTVLTIAHRLHTVIDSDKVLVMDAGEAIEFDHPHNLLQDQNSVFFELVMQTGKAMVENLTTIAKDNYKDILS